MVNVVSKECLSPFFSSLFHQLYLSLSRAVADMLSFFFLFRHAAQ
jgi:hypothetical protein